MRFLLNTFLCLGILLLAAHSSIVAQPLPVELRSDSYVLLNPSTEYFLDTQEREIGQIASGDPQVQFQVFNDKEPSLGRFDGALWVRFTLVNTNVEEPWLYLEPRRLEYIALFWKENGTWHSIKSGGKRALSTRGLPFKDFFLQLHQNVESRQTYYLKIQSSRIISYRIHAGPLEQLIAEYDKPARIFYMYIGLVLVLLLYNAILSAITRKLDYVYYTGYLFFLLIDLAYLQGYAPEIYHLPYLEGINDVFSALFGTFLLIAFSNIVGLKTFSPTLFYLRHILVAGLLTGGLFIPLFGNEIGVEIIFLATYAGVVWATVVTILMILRRNQLGFLFLLAFVAFSLGTLIHILTIKGFLPHTLFTSQALVAGSVTEALLMTLAISLQFRQQILEQRNALLRMNRSMQARNSALEQFTFLIANTLSQPLNQLKSDLNSIEAQEVQDQNWVRNASLIQKSTAQIKEVVTTINDAVEDGMREPVFNGIDPLHLLRESLEPLEKEFEQAGSKVEIIDFPRVIYTDPLVLKKVFSKILTHCVRNRSPEKLLEITISGDQISDEFRFQFKCLGNPAPAHEGSDLEAGHSPSLVLAELSLHKIEGYLEIQSTAEFTSVTVCVPIPKSVHKSEVID